MKTAELRNKTIPELQKLARDLRAKINQLITEKSFNRLKNTNLIKLHKKDLARVLTVLKEKSK
ncbi:MAG: hypothetical protein KatS3mg097_434 [Candidatus Parcubacteria bacterium]|nr:MAG: hypothetical protein KatS3mg097_434 [Candidatus Parcubacteria bacterium]